MSPRLFSVGPPGKEKSLNFYAMFHQIPFHKMNLQFCYRHTKKKTEKEPHQLHFSDPFFTQLASGLQINIVFYTNMQVDV